LDWKTLLLLDYAYIYSLSLVLWRFLEGKLKNVKAFGLAYSTGAHLVFLELCVLLGLSYAVPLLVASYLASVVIAFKRPKWLAQPYLYLAWTTGFALLALLRW
jgi:hypothetical protein